MQLTEEISTFQTCEWKKTLFIYRTYYLQKKSNLCKQKHFNFPILLLYISIIIIIKFKISERENKVFYQICDKQKLIHIGSVKTFWDLQTLLYAFFFCFSWHMLQSNLSDILGGRVNFCSIMRMQKWVIWNKISVGVQSIVGGHPALYY